MKNLKLLLIPGFLVLPSTLFAGVEMNLVTKDSVGEVVESVTFLAQSGKIRMEDIGDSSGNDMSMIFLGQEFIVVDHIDKSYVVMDEVVVQQMGVKVNAAMQQMKEQLASMPPEQRAMMEQMLEQQMGANMDAAEESLPSRVERTGSGSWQSGDCTQYAVFEGTEKKQDICAAPLGDIDGADEAMQAFENMAKFVNSMADSMPDMFGQSMAENPMALMEQIDGFPVRTVDYVDGSMASETTLQSVEEKSLDASLFAVPEGYTKVDPFAGQ